MYTKPWMVEQVLDLAGHYLRALQASNIEKSTIEVKMDLRGLMAGGTEKPQYATEEKTPARLKP